jgi:hypothetical protein
MGAEKLTMGTFSASGSKLGGKELVTLVAIDELRGCEPVIDHEV